LVGLRGVARGRHCDVMLVRRGDFGKVAVMLFERDVILRGILSRVDWRWGRVCVSARVRTGGCRKCKVRVREEPKFA